MHLSQLGMMLGRLMVLAFSAVALGGSTARAESWKPALRDADELYDAAEDLHDRARRLGDPRVVPLTASLENLTHQLYHQLKHNACAADVVPLLENTGALLEEVAARVMLSCEMRTDRKSMAELNNARRYYAATHEHVHCLLHHHSDGPHYTDPHQQRGALQPQYPIGSGGFGFGSVWGSAGHSGHSAGAPYWVGAPLSAVDPASQRPSNRGLPRVVLRPF